MTEAERNRRISPDYLVLWTCEKCGQAGEVLLSRLQTTHCPECEPDRDATRGSGAAGPAERRSA